MFDPQTPRMVTIPAWVDESGTLRFFYGGPLPRLAPGAIVDLSVAEESVESEFHLALLAERRERTLLPAGESLAAEVRFRHASERNEVTNAFVLKDEYSMDPRVAGVVIVLQEDLRIELSLGKPAGLIECSCTIPALADVEARSVNHAYTLISQHFEPHRSSHTGNVFEKVSAWNPKTQAWRTLEDLRDHELRQIEEEFMRACDPWWYCGARGSMPDTWAILDAPGDRQATIHLLKQEDVSSPDRLFESRTTIMQRVECLGRNDALRWLEARRFEHLPDIDYPALRAPRPPSFTTSGEEDATLNWADRAAYLRRMYAYFEARRQRHRRAEEVGAKSA